MSLKKASKNSLGYKISIIIVICSILIGGCTFVPNCFTGDQLNSVNITFDLKSKNNFSFHDLFFIFYKSGEELSYKNGKTLHKTLTLNNLSSKNQQLYLVSDQFILENVEFSYEEEGKWKTASSGWGRPMLERMVPSYLHSFNVTVPARSTKEVFFKVENTYQVTKLPLKIMSKKQFYAYYYKLLIMDGLVIMALLTSILFSIYNIIFSPRYRKMLWLYLVYAVNFLAFYCLRVVAPSVTLEAIPVEYNYLINIAIFTSTYTFLRFAVAFVDTGEIKENKYVSWLIDILFVLTILVSLFPSQVNNPLFFVIKLTFFVGTILYHSVFLIMSLRKNVLAKIYIVMALPLILSGMMEGLTNIFGIIELPSDLFAAFRVSIVLEMLFILFALIYRERFIGKRIKKKLMDTELQLATAQIEIQESEQKRIAQDLHDDLGGTLATLKRFVYDKLSPQKEEDKEQLNYLAKKAGDDLRRISHALMPPDFERAGLVDSVREVILMNNGPGRTIAFQEHGKRQTVSPNSALHIYRIFSEIIQNINKHSKATEILVQFLWSKDELTLMVEDDGSVFNEKNEGLGMKNMKMRASYLNGSINFDHNEKGSTIILEIPL
ncbi:Signal transduction histidine kinase [Spirosomataceae bacterium TFI 002]|nr:Signal transduction histidine kinase [Spirosomataceae bacterium TFI 002]